MGSLACNYSPTNGTDEEHIKRSVRYIEGKRPPRKPSCRREDYKGILTENEVTVRIQGLNPRSPRHFA